MKKLCILIMTMVLVGINKSVYSADNQSNEKIIVHLGSLGNSYLKNRAGKGSIDVDIFVRTGEKVCKKTITTQKESDTWSNTATIGIGQKAEQREEALERERFLRSLRALDFAEQCLYFRESGLDSEED